jgi:ribose 5-phosphate isomerase A
MDEQIPVIAQRALAYVRDGDTIGLGTGAAATGFVRALATRVRAGLTIRGVPTSEGTAALARELGVTLVGLEEAMPLALTVDGADEVDRNLDMVKGLGGALVREKIVAASARRLVILVGPRDVDKKITEVIGTRGVLPVEVLPFGLPLCRRRLAELDCTPELRMARDGKAFVTDNGNSILDCRIGPLADPRSLERQLLSIPGVVGTGLFLGMANVVLIQRGEQVEVRERR